MIKLLLADLVIEIDNQYSYILDACRKYIYTGDKSTNIFIKVTDEEIEKEKLIPDDELEKGYLEYICAYRKIATQLPKFDAFVMHGSVIKVNEKGIAFLASSGTGKTTHTIYWTQLCGRKMIFINGDKPIVRFIDGIPYAYGTPWAGKEGFNTNTRAVLTDLCFIERADHDEVKSISGIAVAAKLLNQIYRPTNNEMLNKTYELVDKLSKSCNLRKIYCTKNITAAETAYKAIFG